jgi:hypothetical protein
MARGLTDVRSRTAGPARARARVSCAAVDARLAHPPTVARLIADIANKDFDLLANRIHQPQPPPVWRSSRARAPCSPQEPSIETLSATIVRIVEPW